MRQEAVYKPMSPEGESKAAKVLMTAENESLVDEGNNQTPGGTHEIHNPIYRRDTRGDPYKQNDEQPWSYRIWIALSVFRRDDLKYAVKVGIGAILYAMWSFIESTRGLYGHWRGEWGLLSYMLVCSMVRSQNFPALNLAKSNMALRQLVRLTPLVSSDSPVHALELSSLLPHG
jgi:hypothetical protein